MSRSGIDVALGVDDAVVAVGAHDVHDRVGLADVGEEAVAEPLALVGAGDETGDVVEVDRVVDELGGADGRGDLVEAPVEDGHDGDVGLDRGEGVVGGLGAGLGERVEERGLAGVGQPTMPMRVLTTPPAGRSGSRDHAHARAPARSRSRRRPERRSGEDVGRIVHAEVQPRERERPGERVQRSGGQPQPRVEPRSGERGRGVGAREAELRRRPGQRGQARQLWTGPPNDQLERGVRGIGGGDGR